MILLKAGIFLSIQTLALSFLVCGCGARYSASELEHTYVTDTQAYHSSTGILLKHKKSPGIANPLSFLTNESVEIMIDGRKAAKYKWRSDFEAFIQLPPGFHRFVVQANTLQGGYQEAEFYLNKDQQIAFETFCNLDGNLFISPAKLKQLQRTADIARKKAAADRQSEAPAPLTLEERLNEIEELYEEGLITKEERDKLRNKVISDY